jgi:hypothetical protein
MPEFNDEYERRVVQRLLNETPETQPELLSRGGTLTSTDLERLFQELRPTPSKPLAPGDEGK